MLKSSQGESALEEAAFIRLDTSGQTRNNNSK